MAVFIDGLLDLIYPPVCILCKEHLLHLSPAEKKIQLCKKCQNKIQKNKPPCCNKCSRPLRSHPETPIQLRPAVQQADGVLIKNKDFGITPKNPKYDLCPTCRNTDSYFDHVWAACIYNDTMRRLIHSFKYGNKTGLRHYFLTLIKTNINMNIINMNEFDFILAVPLHPTRFRERGFNQSQIIADMLSKEFKIPQNVNNLRRTRNTPNQARLSQKERWTNIHSAFKIKASSLVNNKNILIIDDLFTTGATASEIARVLKASGAKRVDIITIAIADAADDKNKASPETVVIS